MTASNFSVALSFTLEAEGGWSDNPNDPGGPTMRGITLATFRAHFPGATVDQLRHITDDQVSDIYRHGYWNAVKGDDLPAGVDLSVFDFGVNAGPGKSIRRLQSALYVKADGILGPVSMKAIDTANTILLIDSLWDRQMSYYEGLIGWDTFGRGWKNRTDQRNQVALNLAGVTS